MILTLDSFFNENWKYFLEGYLILFVVSLLVIFMLKNKKSIGPFIAYILIISLFFVARYFSLTIAYYIFFYLMLFYPIALVVCFAPDIRKSFESAHNKQKKVTLLSNSLKTKNEVADASLYLAKKKIGALITIEKHNSLDQYASKAINLDSEVSKELLINIFTPYTPLHDGAVIIRGNRIRCAGAYYNLTSNQDDIDKTTGSRHRAALGICEVTDSLTICVSEETGDISLAVNGMMVEANDRDKILQYLDLYLQ